MHRSNVRRGAQGIMIVLALALAGCDDDSTGPGGRVETTSVNVDDNFFSPADILVDPGATVTWTWVGSELHNVNFTSPDITDGGNRTSGSHDAVMPMTPGTYAYTCTNHPGMDGSVQVQ